MAINFIGVGAAGYGPRDIKVGIPIGTKPGDFLLLTLYSRGGYPGIRKLPDGWIPMQTENCISSHTALWGYRFAVEGEQGLVISGNGALYNFGIIASYRDVDKNNPVGAFYNKAHIAKDGVLFKTINSTSENAMIIYSITAYVDSKAKFSELINTFQNPRLANISKRYDAYKKRNVKVGGGVAIVDGVYPVPGATGYPSVIPTVPFNGDNMVIALNPAAG